MGKNGGARPGAGRKKGKKNPATLEREAVLKAFNERAMKSAGVLFEAQLTLAQGQTFLYKIEKEKIVGPKGGISYKPKKPVVVTNPEEIANYLDREFVQGNIADEADRAATYYYLTSVKPENEAIEALLNRSLGKAVQPLSGPDGGPLKIELVQYANDSATS